MKKIWKLVIILSFIAAIISLEVYVYINTKGIGGSYCTGPPEGRLEMFNITEDRRTAKFVIELQIPYQVEKWSTVNIALNISGEIIKLRYNSSLNRWFGDGYSANIYDNIHDGVINSGDYLILHSSGDGFAPCDKVILSFVGYPGDMEAYFVRW